MKLGKYTTNRIYIGDCLRLIDYLPTESIDLTLTSPPYDRLRTYGTNGSETQFGVDEIDDLSKKLFRVTKVGGVCVWVVGDQAVKGSETGTSMMTALMIRN